MKLWSQLPQGLPLTTSTATLTTPLWAFMDNLLTPFKFVNGRIEKAVDVVVDSDSDVSDLNDLSPSRHCPI
jgi:hypothetical protein